ncbi:unnamed protein product [Amoebophrya sp. A120]|nr:unnamed protein product [Amoebophrya sp. A120]|eukprot:GSA120T00010893001.1
MSAAPQRILVTGANKGIGFHIVRLMAHHLTRTRQPAEIFLGCRNVELGEKARRDVEAELQASSGAGKNGGPASSCVSLKFVQLDLTAPATMTSAAQKIGPPLHVLVNNAGMAFKGDAFSVEVAARTIGTNFEGTMLVTEAFLPLLLDGATYRPHQDPPRRIVNVCSMAGLLKNRYSAQLKQRWLACQSKEDILALTTEFIAKVREDTYAQFGWPRQTYAVSKAAEIAFTRLLARDLADQNVLVYPCCPGWCRTDMAGDRAPRSAEEGADTPTWLALENVYALQICLGLLERSFALILLVDVR